MSRPSTVDAYLAALPADRRRALSAVRDAIRKSLPKGYEEGIQYGMIGWYVPHSLYPDGYHCDPKQPVPFAGLASQKNHMSLYLMCSYGDPEQERWLREAWAKAGKRLDMGKACIRFKKLEDVPLKVVGQAVKRVPVSRFLARYEAVVKTGGKRRKATAKKASAKKASATKKAAKKKASGRTAAKKVGARKAAARKTARRP